MYTNLSNKNDNNDNDNNDNIDNGNDFEKPRLTAYQKKWPNKIIQQMNQANMRLINNKKEEKNAIKKAKQFSKIMITMRLNVFMFVLKIVKMKWIKHKQCEIYNYV